MQTEIGKIAELLQEEEEVRTPLQKRLQAFGKSLSLLVLFICAFIFIIEVLVKGEDLLKMLLTSISLAVAAIPEALPAVITISLALGAKRMAEHKALIRKLPAVETLGSVTYICTDKTGTLTLNQMKIEELWAAGKRLAGKEIKNLFLSEAFLPQLFGLALALSNDAKLESSGKVLGDPTETALYEFARENGFDRFRLEEKFPRVAEIPFDSVRKCMTTFHQVKKEDVQFFLPGEPSFKFISFTKGAVEVLLEKSGLMVDFEGEKHILSPEEILKAAEEMASDGLRVLCLGVRFWQELPGTISPEVVEKDLAVIGLVGMLDPPREEAKEAVEECKKAGIKPVMITGDHPLTARTIAERLGIIDGDSEAVLSGRELEKLSLEEFEKHVEHIRVYARVAPEQKLKIVKALQDKGELVAMTGDGVNDAPALKRADIGVAMGITGTDVAKESAHMILLDDNFATIVQAVREGRQIFDNIRKFIKYILGSNIGEVWTIFFAPFIGLPVPLLPIHILWINLVTDSLPAIALTAEPPEKDVMNRPPRDPREGLFADGLGFYIVWVGILIGSLALLIQAWSIKTGEAHWQTMVFCVLCFSQLWHVLAVRSEKESLFSRGFFTNLFLLFSIFLIFLLQLATVYLPFLNPIFKTQPLSLSELSLTVLISSLTFLAVEISKFLKRLKENSSS